MKVEGVASTPDVDLDNLESEKELKVSKDDPEFLEKVDPGIREGIERKWLRLR